MWLRIRLDHLLLVCKAVMLSASRRAPRATGSAVETMQSRRSLHQRPLAWLPSPFSALVAYQAHAATWNPAFGPLVVTLPSWLKSQSCLLRPGCTDEHSVGDEGNDFPNFLKNKRTTKDGGWDKGRVLYTENSQLPASSLCQGQTIQPMCCQKHSSELGGITHNIE